MQGYVSWKHEDDKVIVFERANCLFAFNFHPTKSFPDYRVGTNLSGSYKIVLDSDEERFGGFGRLNKQITYEAKPEPYAGRAFSFQVYNKTV